MTHITFRRVTARQSNICLAVDIAVRVRERLALAVHLCLASIAPAPRHYTAPQHGLP